MTTIAYDGQILATDSQCTAGGKIQNREEQKLYKYKNGEVCWYVALAGDVSTVPEVLRWLLKGMGCGQPPQAGEWWGILVMYTGGVYRAYELDNLGPHQIPKANPFSIGSGNAYAMGAMYSGLDAIQAIKVASQLDVWTNDRIQCVRLNKDGPQETRVVDITEWEFNSLMPLQEI